MLVGVDGHADARLLHPQAAVVRDGSRSSSQRRSDQRCGPGRSRPAALPYSSRAGGIAVAKMPSPRSFTKFATFTSRRVSPPVTVLVSALSRLRPEPSPPSATGTGRARDSQLARSSDRVCHRVPPPLLWIQHCVKRPTTPIFRIQTPGGSGSPYWPGGRRDRSNPGGRRGRAARPPAGKRARPRAARGGPRRQPSGWVRRGPPRWS
jgi:hypothetical protein